MKQAAKDEPSSPEFRAFEEFTRKFLAVPKRELNRRIELERAAKSRAKRLSRKSKEP
jgi:hypothetical protein